MKYRKLGSIGWEVSEISFGAWAIGGSWGAQSDDESLAALRRAVELGVNFIDTADVYGDWRSERLIGQLKRECKEKIYIATKAGRRLNPHTADGYNEQNLTQFVERSLKNLATDCLDLVQLHCPPTEVYYRPEVFGVMDRLKSAGKLRHYGVSVEKVEEALKAIEFPGVQSVQIIFNMFRHRPAEHFFSEAKRRNVGIIIRVPLASGLLTGTANVSWALTAGDTPPISLSQQLEFSTDNGSTWIPVANNLPGTQTSLALDTHLLPMTSTGKLRLLIADGLNNVTVNSLFFYVGMRYELF